MHCNYATVLGCVLCETDAADTPTANSFVRWLAPTVVALATAAVVTAAVVLIRRSRRSRPPLERQDRLRSVTRTAFVNGLLPVAHLRDNHALAVTVTRHGGEFLTQHTPEPDDGRLRRNGAPEHSVDGRVGVKLNDGVVQSLRNHGDHTGVGAANSAAVAVSRRIPLPVRTASGVHVVADGGWLVSQFSSGGDCHSPAAGGGIESNAVEGVLSGNARLNAGSGSSVAVMPGALRLVSKRRGTLKTRSRVRRGNRRSRRPEREGLPDEVPVTQGVSTESSVDGDQDVIVFV